MRLGAHAAGLGETANSGTHRRALHIPPTSSALQEPALVCGRRTLRDRRATTYTFAGVSWYGIHPAAQTQSRHKNAQHCEVLFWSSLLLLSKPSGRSLLTPGGSQQANQPRPVWTPPSVNPLPIEDHQRWGCHTSSSVFPTSFRKLVVIWVRACRGCPTPCSWSPAATHISTTAFEKNSSFLSSSQGLEQSGMTVRPLIGHGRRHGASPGGVRMKWESGNDWLHSRGMQRLCRWLQLTGYRHHPNCRHAE